MYFNHSAAECLNEVCHTSFTHISSLIWQPVCWIVQCNGYRKITNIKVIMLGLDIRKKVMKLKIRY